MQVLRWKQYSIGVLASFFFERLWPVRTVDSKVFFYNISWFRFLEGLHNFNVAIIPCLWKIFLDLQAQTLLISGTRKGEGRNVEDVMDGPVLLLLRSEIFFLFFLSIFWQLPKGSWGPWEEDQAMPHQCTSLFAYAVCCPRVPSTSLLIAIQDESLCRHLSHCVPQSLWSEKDFWELYMLIYILKGPKCISVHWLVYNLLIVVEEYP